MPAVPAAAVGPGNHIIDLIAELLDEVGARKAAGAIGRRGHCSFGNARAKLGFYKFGWMQDSTAQESRRHA